MAISCRVRLRARANMKGFFSRFDLGPYIVSIRIGGENMRAVTLLSAWLIPLTQVTPYPPSARPSGLAVATDAQLYGRRSILNHGVFLAVSGGPIARQARCGVHLS